MSREYARYLNAGAREEVASLFARAREARVDPDVSGIAADGFGEQDVIEIAPDRQTARALLHCTIDVERAIGPDCPLLQMARQQGGGVLRRTERVVFENTYVRRDGIWKIQRSEYRSA